MYIKKNKENNKTGAVSNAKIRIIIIVLNNIK